MHISKLAAITFDNSKYIDIYLVDLILAVLNKPPTLTIWLAGIMYALC